MRSEYEYDMDPVSFITVGAIGPPGQRVFYLQAARDQDLVSLVIEKEQAAALAASIERLLAALQARDPQSIGEIEPLVENMDLRTPIEEAFRVTQLGIGVDEERHMIVVVAYETADDEPGIRARFVASYEQMLTLSRHAMDVVQQGRPVCELCGEPMDPEGHFCPRRNGRDKAQASED